MNESFKILNIELENLVRDHDKTKLNQIKKIQNLFNDRLADLNNYKFLPSSNWKNIDNDIDDKDDEIKPFLQFIDALEKCLDAIYSINKEELYDSSNNFINKMFDYSKSNKNDWQNTSTITNIADYVDLHTILYSFRKKRNPDSKSKIHRISPEELLIMKKIKKDLKDFKKNIDPELIHTKHLTENYNTSNKSQRIKTRDFNELIQKLNKDQDIDMLKIINLLKLFYQKTIILISPYAIEIPEYNQNIISFTESDLFDDNLISIIKNLNNKTTLIFNLTIDENNYYDNQYVKTLLNKIENILNLKQENLTTFRISPVINKDITLKQIEGVIDFQIHRQNKDQQPNKTPLNIFEYFLPILKVHLDLSKHIDNPLESRYMSITTIRDITKAYLIEVYDAKTISSSNFNPHFNLALACLRNTGYITKGYFNLEQYGYDTLKKWTNNEKALIVNHLNKRTTYSIDIKSGFKSGKDGERNLNLSNENEIIKKVQLWNQQFRRVFKYIDKKTDENLEDVCKSIALARQS